MNAAEIHELLTPADNERILCNGPIERNYSRVRKRPWI
jgi:hypothetical protein